MTRDEFIREQLSKEYPRLDIRCGGSYAKPWEKVESEPFQHGWINEKGEVVPFEPVLAFA